MISSFSCSWVLTLAKELLRSPNLLLNSPVSDALDELKHSSVCLKFTASFLLLNVLVNVQAFFIWNKHLSCSRSCLNCWLASISALCLRQDSWRFCSSSWFDFWRDCISSKAFSNLTLRSPSSFWDRSKALLLHFKSSSTPLSAWVRLIISLDKPATSSFSFASSVSSSAMTRSFSSRLSFSALSFSSSLFFLVRS